MSDVEPVARKAPQVPEWLKGRVGLIVGALAIMWASEIIDTAPGLDLDDFGIRPRMVDSLDGILWSPFLHFSFGHLIANTIPFAILSGLVLVRGARRWLIASVIIIALGGLAVWALSPGTNELHAGASGWVFGLFGFLLASAAFERKPLSIGIALVALVLYGGTLIIGFVPRPGLSWEGHLFGFIAGVVAARLMTPRKISTNTPETSPAS